ncbi:winged helix-turn-helix transcriptional regulator [Streptomyces sp. MMG1121]|uniref:winged helix-turn-helix transcriptional regulator n=1 Tax=Streptomyces sp. MMG1121 TaxID=1415544 RepID=UPI0006AFB597|nr:helix-turn-helix domain-containing protein [Streptomyces sp. MMG1121]KOV56869.1 HxlR family transcriptional regulator [Streptomyces sp. MMG1121]
MTTTDRALESARQEDACRTRVVLDIVADKWSLLVVRNLRQGPRRFTELKRAIDGISQRMLTVTLRSLERDGILTRTVRNVMPPHVTYELTPMGITLREAAAPLLEWSIAHLTHIDTARAAYDARTGGPSNSAVSGGS